jgi:hypothetical protein
LGGLRLPDVATIAPLAHCAAVVSARQLFPNEVPVSWATAAAHDRSLAPYPDVRTAMCDATLSPVVRGQRAWTAQMNLANFKALFDSSSLADQARLQSLQAKTTSLWLSYSPLTCAEGIWFEPSLFATACRMRLGLPVRDDEVPCLRCEAQGRPKTKRDVFGHHTLACMVGNPRCLMHNAVVHRLVADAAFGLLHPIREAHPFGDNDRLDIVLRAGPREQLLDVAITCPFRVSGNSLSKAASTPGGWATEYESTKRARYSAKCGPNQDLIPVVFDTFGAAGVSARPALHRIATAFSKRFGERTGRLVFFARLITLIVSKTAAIVCNEA